MRSGHLKRQQIEKFSPNQPRIPAGVRTLTTASAAITYTAADQTADFGAPQSSLAVRVAQVSASVGRGTPRNAVV